MLHPAFLLAAAVTGDGWMELPAVAPAAFPLARLQVAPAGDGQFVQRVVPSAGRAGDWRPLDMACLARSLGLAFGSVAPDLFAVRGVGGVGQSQGRLARADPASDEARLRILRGAFLVHQAAYEARPA